ncbi:Xanthine/uracil permease [Tilletiaria anomala UBC 951]|uniref:Xanthine/uracil permease n=1 Tax=Tilletiaria anomala (strain ATCC 24038 / CBS 436.72 / UBC 951) TaxID=1037660 RepID=A0A066W8P6_TILAU|nr:Xanthine/uracil permease [Tilletiaria anomala UBC 951]KDN47160.1 Xanthine/uracil permease [Tilletiaria anomala UBC 951]
MAARRKADEASELPFYGLDDELPIVLAAICGFQHCLAMLAGIITPPIILASSLSLPSAIQSYLISASLISSGLLSAIQISGIPLPFIRRQLGTGLLSVVGTSFTTITTAMSIFKGLYTDGTCPSMTSADGTVTRGACPEAYGYLLGTAAVCSLLEIFLSFLPVRIMRRLFPPAVTGVTVMLIGASLIGESGVVNWGGGSSCHGRPTSGMYTVCPAVGGPHALPWGSPQYIGLGFLSFMTIVLVEIFGSPVMRNASIVIGLLLPLAVAGPTGYMSRASIDSAPAITFLWTTTFKLKVYGPGVLAMLAVYICLMMEAIGDITATSEVSRLPVDGESFNRRLQGGVLSDGLGGLLSALFTTTPQSVFAQNNGVISITRIANRRAGYWCCFWLILLGILGKFSGAILAIPNSVLGGVTTFLFASVVVSGLKIISTVKFTRRNRFILAASLSFGFGVLLVSDFFEYLFSYSGPNKALEGFLTSITIVLSTPFLISAVVSMVLNFLLPYDVEDLVEVARRKKADVERGHLGQEQAQEQVADVERDIESLEKSAEGVAAEKGA